MAEETQPKWEGKSTVKLRGPTPDEVWPLLEDFCSINKWLPGIDTSYQVEGVHGQPGLIRYCASTVTSSSDGDEKTVSWCKEKLLSIDPIKRCFSYEVLENNVGFNSYVATMDVLPINGDDELGCQIEWSYVADPLDGWTQEFLDSYIKSSLHEMAEKLEKAILATE
ncbi:lachrymatory-factor synthase-like [Cornus florida]|uniref:lachrymatory-factor synthase-like n=1 Tax=Cornus florida TaxID=4283 RepID=UPI0028985021|nr:lachrymatory-factor synthase-like [Cornus florida]